MMEICEGNGNDNDGTDEIENDLFTTASVITVPSSKQPLRQRHRVVPTEYRFHRLPSVTKLLRTAIFMEGGINFIMLIL
jgi:hypothetical protein